MNGEIDNGMKPVPSVLLEPIAVTKDNINDTIVKDEFWSVDEICTGKYAAGLQGGRHPVGLRGRMPAAPSWRRRHFRAKGASRNERDWEHARARAEGGEQELRPGPGAQRRRLRAPRRRGRRARGRQRGRQVDAGQDDRGDPPRRHGHDLVRGPGGDDHEPHRRDGARDRDRLPGPRPVRQPRRRREPLPRPRADGRGARWPVAPARRDGDGEAHRRAARDGSR